ncbi:hypothetical protein R20233_01440 [Ralstonia sp. LMG 32965]|uniref:hypothetical protein n=1 Tax=Ralstonia flatus TaxID=3058601 RepID=UPI0028F5ED24|nr:hypothetical protein [Ralstonia sp. LMG 32965]CAJ0867744.1 hypothetical protein R20233_01440 [Ralstonia sp. LMG 32965]
MRRRIARSGGESHLDWTKTLEAFDFGMVPMVSKAHVPLEPHNVLTSEPSTLVLKIRTGLLADTSP